MTPSADWITHKTKAKIADAINHHVVKSSTRLSTSRIIHTLMTNPMKPIVNRFSGAVIVLRNAPKVAFTTAKTTATNRAHINQSTCTPGTIYVANKTASADNKRCHRNFIASQVRK